MGEVNPTFGQIVVHTQVEKAMLALLEEWLPTYLAEVERQNDIEPCSIARPKSYATSVEADLNPAERMPAIIAVSPGTTGEPTREGDQWDAWFQITVVALVMTPEEMSTRDMCGFYAAAIRSLVLQHASLGSDLVVGTVWDGEEYQGEPGDQRNRTRGAALVHFRVKIGNLVDRSRGPLIADVDNPCDPVPEISTVQTVEIDVNSDDL
jgi:hypothetical protein